MPTIAHISDLHLQSGVEQRQRQAEPVVHAAVAAKPDLIVISGDLTDDGWDSIDELRWSKAWLDERIKCPLMVLPGNHDVGNFAGAKAGSVDSSRVSQWAHVFTTPSSFVFENWSVLGINSMLFGSGIEAESAQSDWIERQLRNEKKAGRSIAFFLHSPFFVDSIEETANPAADYWLGSRAPRQSLYAVLKDAGVKLVGTGHVHQTRLYEDDETVYAWAPPASGTWVHAPGLPNPEPPDQSGLWLHKLDTDGSVHSALVNATTVITKIYYKPMT